MSFSSAQVHFLREKFNAYLHNHVDTNHKTDLHLFGVDSPTVTPVNTSRETGFVNSKENITQMQASHVTPGNTTQRIFHSLFV